MECFGCRSKSFYSNNQCRIVCDKEFNCGVLSRGINKIKGGGSGPVDGWSGNNSDVSSNKQLLIE